MRNKYGSKKTKFGGENFDSRTEARRYEELLLLLRAGEISNLRRQVPFTLIPAQDGERACKYIADFVYTDKNGAEVVEDAKGFKTKDYIIKRKLMQYLVGIKIKEV